MLKKVREGENRKEAVTFGNYEAISKLGKINFNKVVGLSSEMGVSR